MWSVCWNWSCCTNHLYILGNTPCHCTWVGGEARRGRGGGHLCGVHVRGGSHGVSEGHLGCPLTSACPYCMARLKPSYIALARKALLARCRSSIGNCMSSNARCHPCLGSSLHTSEKRASWQTSDCSCARFAFCILHHAAQPQGLTHPAMPVIAARGCP